MTPWLFSKLGFEFCYDSLLHNFSVKWIILNLLIDEVLKNSNGTLSIRIITNKQAFLLHHILGYLK